QQRNSGSSADIRNCELWPAPSAPRPSLRAAARGMRRLSAASSSYPSPSCRAPTGMAAALVRWDPKATDPPELNPPELVRSDNDVDLPNGRRLEFVPDTSLQRESGLIANPDRVRFGPPGDLILPEEAEAAELEPIQARWQK